MKTNYKVKDRVKYIGEAFPNLQNRVGTICLIDQTTGGVTINFDATSKGAKETIRTVGEDQLEMINPFKGMEMPLTASEDKKNTHVPITSTIKDSGDRTVYSTGAQRDRRIGKGMPCLIPTHALKRVSLHYELGRNKYSTANGDNLTGENWKKGFPLCDMWDSAIRHLNSWKIGMVDEDHLAACVWNVMGIMELQRRVELGILPRELDNRDVNEFEEPRDLYEGLDKLD